jgi:hypothetical protein
MDAEKSSAVLLGSLDRWFLRCLLLLPHLAKLLQFLRQAMPQWAFGAKFFQQRLGSYKGVFVDLPFAEQHPPRT